MENKNMIKCKVCSNDIAKGVKKCVHCGKDQRSFFKKHKILTGILVFILIGIIGGALGDDKEPQDNNAQVATETIVTTEPIETTKITESTEVTKVVEDVPREHKSALKKAEIYSDDMHMSKVSVYDQLVSEYGEKFPKEAAQYAIDNLEADWKANALNKAKLYANDMHMSKLSVYDQLISEYGEKFTKEEAQYAIDNLEADWKANALNKAKLYANDMNMSKVAVYDQLISEYGERFTKEEAQYAVDNLE